MSATSAAVAIIITPWDAAGLAALIVVRAALSTATAPAATAAALGAAAIKLGNFAAFSAGAAVIAAATSTAAAARVVAAARPGRLGATRGRLGALGGSGGRGFLRAGGRRLLLSCSLCSYSLRILVLIVQEREHVVGKHAHGSRSGGRPGRRRSFPLRLPEARRGSEGAAAEPALAKSRDPLCWTGKTGGSLWVRQDEEMPRVSKTRA
mmetsp:Transcript_20522/g.56892  ORF Transcript_20522/g.56892 Transcript_20522/m.56892 type:complete len:208 (+) Transcript_20522:1046-1669(+)